MSRHSRREFLQGAAGAVAAYTLLPSSARADVNSQIRMAVVGVHGRGRNHIEAFHDNLVALCDCDRDVLGQRAETFEKDYNRKLDQIVDYRDLLDRQDIDAITVATPNHTHALIATAAAAAGKDVYCEKPVSQCIWEGRQIVAAAKRYGRIIQTGTQARSSRCLQQAVAEVRGGMLGPIQYVVGTCYKPRPSIGKLQQPLQIPGSLDYDLWCGPAAKVDLYRPRLHYDWHWDFNTGNGDIGNQGLHQMDIARWFLGETAPSPRVISFGGRFGYDDAGNTPNTLVTLHDYPAAPLIFETRGLPKSKEAQQDWAHSMDRYLESQIGVIVHCEGGHVFADNSYQTVLAFNPDGEQIARWDGGGDHFANFLDAVRSRRPEDLNASILKGHISAALCHTANISYELGEKRTAAEIIQSAGDHEHLRDSVERMITHLRANEVDVDNPTITAGVWLDMDPASERFTNSEEANDLARREDRSPYVVPQIA